MNIEEIKGRSANFKEEYLPFFNNNGEMREWNAMYEDNLHLLSVIEQAEKALDEIYNIESLCEVECLMSSLVKVQEISKEALQAIRK